LINTAAKVHDFFGLHTNEQKLFKFFFEAASKILLTQARKVKERRSKNVSLYRHCEILPSPFGKGKK
jgi:hypothetical protein